MAGLTQAGSGVTMLANFNRSRVVQALFRAGECTRADLARETDLTPATITNIVKQLISWGIATEAGGHSGRGRAISVRLNLDRHHVIGVKIGRKRAEMAVFDLGGSLDEPTHHWLDYDKHTDPGDIVAPIRRWIDAQLAARPTIRAVGIAVPGPYLRDEGRISVWARSYSIATINFLDAFKDAFDVPVFVEQDAHCGALALKLFSNECAGEDCLAYLLAGEGVGLGVIDHDAFVNGEAGSAGEIGHISIDINGRPCECNGRGCLERYCSTGALRDIVANGHPGLAPHAADSSAIDVCRAVFSIAHDPDDARRGEALDVIREIGGYLGHGCVIAINGFDPRAIVVGDVMAEAGEPLLEEMRRVALARSMDGIGPRVRIMLSDLPVDPALCGAAAVAIERLLDSPETLAAKR